MTNAIYLEAPGVIGPSLFMAGGITDCPDWQAEFYKMMSNERIVLFNPRRENFPIHDPSASKAQIAWEFDHMKRADMISFWFPAETLCPIELFELGRWSWTDKTIFVGTDPEYERRRDVIIQLDLARPDVKVASSLKSLVDQVKIHLRETLGIA